MIALEESEGLIDDPAKGIAYCNKHIKTIEDAIVIAKKDEDIRAIAKLEGHLLGWTELLQKYIFQQFQMAKGKQDLTKHIQDKKRFTGR